jgi:formylglycine-generating enzyme required for sulfatase activity
LNDKNTYFATGPASAFAAWDTLGTTPTTGAEQKRTQALSTGGVVWDVGGNIWQWVLDNNDTNAGNFGASSGLRAGTGTWYEYNDTATLTAGDKLLFGSAGGYTSAQNTGQVFGGSVGAVLRGGRWASAARTGVFGGALDNGVSTAGASFGFRCVYVP